MWLEILLTILVVAALSISVQIWYLSQRVENLHVDILKKYAARKTNREPLRELQRVTDRLIASEEEERALVELMEGNR